MAEQADPRFERVHSVLMSYKMALATTQDEHARTVVATLGETLVDVLMEWARRDADARPAIESVLDRAGIRYTRGTGLSD